MTYIEATTDDIALANRLAHEVLGRSLDELPPQPRRLLEALDVMVDEIAAEREIDRDRVRFTRRQVRERLGGGDTQFKKHLARLVYLELVRCHRGRARAGSSTSCWTAGHDGTRFLPGLVDLDDLGEPITPTDPRLRRGIGRPERGRGRGVVGPRSQGGRPPVGTAVPDPKPQANGQKSPSKRSGGRDARLARRANHAVVAATTTAVTRARAGVRGGERHVEAAPPHVHRGGVHRGPRGPVAPIGDVTDRHSLEFHIAEFLEWSEGARLRRHHHRDPQAGAGSPPPLAVGTAASRDPRR